MLFEINQEACVACLACVRACPTTAIEADETRLSIAQDSCVRCGNCLPACDHGAIEVHGDLYTALTDAVVGEAVLILGVEAEVFFYPSVPEQVVNAAHKAGFRWVYRGIIGDELVADEYRKLWKGMPSGTMIRSTCPVVVETIRRDYPILVPFLAPVKTPLAAEAAYVRARHGDKIRIVYAGTCIPGDDAEIDASITLNELAELFRIRRVTVEDEPRVFERIPEERRRYLSAAGGLPIDLLAKESHTSRRFHKMRGLGHVGSLAKAVAEDGIDFGFVDLLPCEGCLDNPMLGPKDELYLRKRIQAEAEPARSNRPLVDGQLMVNMKANHDPVPSKKNGIEPEEIEGVLARIGPADELGTPWNCRACGFDTCEKFAKAFLHGRATLRQCPPYQERRAEEQAKLAAVDELTGLATYRVLKDRLEQEVARSKRTGTPFVLLFVDMDRFKQVNDGYGHEVGNTVLQLAAKAITSKLRTTDLAARYGGDEFVLFLAGAQAEGGRKVAEEVRGAVEAAGLEAGYPSGMVTASVGVTVANAEARETDLLEASDRALYRAKKEGGNLVV